MKNQFVLALSTVIISASLFSCAPKDDKIQSAANALVTAQSVNIESDKKESARFLAVSLDRAFEGLALVKAVINADYAKVQNLATNDDQFETDILDVTTGKHLEGTQTGQFSSRVSYTIEKQELNQDGKLTLLVLKSENTKLETKHFTDATAKGAFVSSNNMNDRLVITKGVREKSYILTIEKTEELGLAKNTTAYANTQIKLEFSWDGSKEMLDQAVKVTAVRINARMLGARSGAITLKDISSALEVKLDACISATGELKIVKDNKTKIGEQPAELPVTIVTLDDSSLTMDGVSSKAQACNVRPRVDLTRYLR
ncbi:hypothetical protein CIK05_10060 [Bdellovibrio sp. qaytius]|nr:hypothetical protein CIK05_10060 [Bdellovibrio sp. qaytius]